MSCPARSSRTRWTSRRDWACRCRRSCCSAASPARRTSRPRLCAALNLRFVDFDETTVQPQAARLVPESLARTYTAIGVEIEHDTVVVAFADPADRGALDEVSTAIHAETGYTVVIAGAERQELLGGDRAGVREELDRRQAARRPGHRPRAAPDVRTPAGAQRLRPPPRGRGATARCACLGELQRLPEFDVLTGSRIRELVVLDHHQAPAGDVRGEPRARHELHVAGLRALPREHLPEAQRRRGVVPPDPVHRGAVRRARHAGIGAPVHRAAPGPGPRDRSRRAPESPRPSRRSSTW